MHAVYIVYIQYYYCVYHWENIFGDFISVGLALYILYFEIPFQRYSLLSQQLGDIWHFHHRRVKSPSFSFTS